MDENTQKCRHSTSRFSHINNLDDGCLMHIFSFLSPIPDRYNTALVCHRWLFLACHPRLWLRVDRAVKAFTESGVFPSIEEAVSAARPGDTILIGAGGFHFASNIQIKKPLCLEPVAFLGGMFAGILRLDLNEDPLKEWVTRTVEASGITEEELELQKITPDEVPQQIEIE